MYFFNLIHLTYCGTLVILCNSPLNKTFGCVRWLGCFLVFNGKLIIYFSITSLTFVLYYISVSTMCFYNDYCVHNYKSTELASLYMYIGYWTLNKYYYYNNSIYHLHNTVRSTLTCKYKLHKPLLQI